MNGFIFYEGPSLIDGSPIVAIATLESSNVKTGNMVQTWIIRADMSPVAAVKTGADAAICGNCRHRGNGTSKRSCYVNVGQAPAGIYRAFAAGSYPTVSPAKAASIISGRAVRVGSYGDPAAIPAHIWAKLLSKTSGHTGYTHQWRNAPKLRSIVMASVDSEVEANEARTLGWRFFRVRTSDMPLMPRESICPASDEGGNKLQCISCRACNGAGSGRRGSIAIVVHGAMRRNFSAAA